jgi:Tfp pilus assembly protein PilO
MRQMPAIPEWAIGVGLIVVIIGAVQLVWHLLVPESARRAQKVRAIMTGDSAQALEEVQSRLGELNQLKQRVNELEERLDFTERMLASQRDAQRLGPPKA